MNIPVMEAYRLLKEVGADITRIVRSLSRRQIRRLLDAYERGLNAINGMCIKVIAEAQVAEESNRPFSLSLEDRSRIVHEICSLAEQLNVIVESPRMSSFLEQHPRLMKRAYLKMYGEREEYLPQDISATDTEFVAWVNRVHAYIGDLLEELAVARAGL